MSEESEAGKKSYPKVRMAMSFSHSKSAGAGGAPLRLAVFDMEPGSVEAMMGSLGWTGRPAQEARPEWAAAAMAEALEALGEQAANMCGYDHHGFEGNIQTAMDMADEDWKDAMQGKKPWRSEALRSGVQMRANLWLSMGSNQYPEGSVQRAAEVAERHELCSRQFVASMLDQCARMGAPCSVGWSKGFAGGSASLAHGEGESKIPEKWNWGSKLGAGLCLELEGGSAACALLSPSEVRRLRKEPAGMALSCWARLRLFGIHPAIMKLCSGAPIGRSYLASALGREAGGFALQTFAAEHGSSGRPQPMPSEAMDALRELAPRGWALEHSAGSGMASAALVGRFNGVEHWLGNVRGKLAAQEQSREIAKAAGPAGKSAAGGAPRI